MIFAWPALETVLSAAPSVAGSLEASKSCPGTRPIFAIRSTIGRSSGAGGLCFIASARAPKYAAASMRST